MKALYVIIGAGIGAPTRYVLDLYLRKFLKYPYGITLINVLGSFILGLSIGSSDNFHAFIGLGFTGAFTTWSTFILDLYLAFELKQYKSAALNLLLSLIVGIGAVWVGIQLV
ncbi:MAG: CrcB family protein [Candidatus Nanopelagicaceae bacterium]|jgi:CrcB protein